MPFREFKRLEIPDVVLVSPEVFYDVRGFFMEVYKRTDFWANDVYVDIVQVNISWSRRGVIRGLHYQLKPMEQGKLFTVLIGRVFAVALDIRRNSPYFGKYVTVELSDRDRKLLWIPPGFAFGFQALEDSLVMYLVTKEYSPQHEACIDSLDPELSIPWPIKENIIRSEKDEKCPKFREARYF